MNLKNLPLRGMAFLKEHKNQELGSSKSSQLILLDSRGFLHHVSYTALSNYVLPKSQRLLSIREFLRNKQLLEAKLTPQKRNRGESLYRRLAPALQKKNRSKSQMMSTLPPSEIKILDKIAPSKASKSPFISVKSTERKSLNNLFSANLSKNSLFPRVFQKMFPMPDDPMRKAILFLNKQESDVTFKVEDQEFPAHKSILSERCKFFKNMFSSKIFVVGKFSRNF